MFNDASMTAKVESDATLKGSVQSDGSVRGTVVIGGGSGAKDAVRYSPQELTPDEAKQARANIGVIGEAVSGTVQTPYAIDQQSLEIVLKEVSF